MSKEVSTLRFKDEFAKDTGVVITRVVKGKICLALSLEHNGDIEIALSPDDCLAVIESLQKAVKLIEQK